MPYRIIWLWQPIGHADGPWRWYAVVHGHYVTLIEFEEHH